VASKAVIALAFHACDANVCMHEPRTRAVAGASTGIGVVGVVFTGASSAAPARARQTIYREISVTRASAGFSMGLTRANTAASAHAPAA
jgi:hypothetical protein